MNKFKNAIGIIKACGLNIKGDRKLMEDAKQIERTIIEALEKQVANNPKTKYDLIKNMSIDELAEFLCDNFECDICPAFDGNYCPNGNLKICSKAMKKHLESGCDTE